MVSRAVQTALARLWTDRCTIYGQKDVPVLGTHLTDSGGGPDGTKLGAV